MEEEEEEEEEGVLVPPEDPSSSVARFLDPPKAVSLEEVLGFRHGGVELANQSQSSSSLSEPISACGELAELMEGLGDPLLWGFDVEDVLTGSGESVVDPTMMMMGFDAGESSNTGYRNVEAPVVPLNCEGCCLLREIIHSNGTHTVKLSIHGVTGVLYHAIVDVHYILNGIPTTQQNFVDFSTESIGWVKQFLQEYSRVRSCEGFSLVHDSLCTFYDVLCTPMDGGVVATPTPTAKPCRTTPQEIEGGPSGVSRTGIAAQRERTLNMRLKDLVGYFHLPITSAAKELQVCSTALKKVCRRNGVKRWPHRKIKSINRMIASLKKSMDAKSGEEATRIRAQIQRLEEEKVRACTGTKDRRI